MESQAAELHQDRAQKLEESGHHAAAYEAYCQAWREDPSSVRLAEKAGVTAERAGHHFAAVQWYSTALTHPGARPFVWLALGRSLERTADWNGAGYAYRQYARRLSRAGRPVLEHEGGKLPVETAIRYAALERPDYAHALRHAAQLAQKLGVSAIRVAEFGVASGRGLLSLVRHAEMMTEQTGVDIEVWGFDTGEGLPAPEDHRDMPHYFGAGDYTMQDKALLEERLRGARLVIGDAGDTAEKWVAEGPPIGALLFDMDLYSSTMGVLRHMDPSAGEEHFLPRVSLTFDDLLPKDRRYTLKDYSSFTGEAAVIADFNEAHSSVKIDSDKYFEALPEHAVWHSSCYIMHRFDHPQYRTRIRESAVDHRPLQL